MKMMQKKELRTCLSMLLIVTCFLASFLFYIDSKAQDEIVDRFYILDEEGNPVTVEITQEDINSGGQNTGIKLFSRLRSSVDTKANVVGIVRFQSSKAGVVNYTEADTGRKGYFNCYSAGDAAYLGTDNDGNIICKLAGVVMKVPETNKKEIVSYSDCGEKQLSYYSVLDNTYLVHSYTYYNGSDLAMASTRVGYRPSYLTSGVKYYSYDGHYFYTDFAKMISDYQNNTYSNAVNASTPYYNYYQYLSFHTTANFTAEQYNAHVAEKKDESVMLTTGNAFVNAQNKYTINALLMYGVAINESGWGTSPIAKEKNNLFGLKAVDASPGQSADSFQSVESCIDDYAYGWIHKGYLNGTDGRYRGAHLGDKHSGLNVKYASDPYWGEKAAARGYHLDTQKSDYGRYTIGIALGGNINFYKDANSSSKVIYTSEAGEGKGQEAYLYDFPMVILSEVIGNNNQKFYKVISDMSLKHDRSGRDVTAIYNSGRDYVYVLASDVRVVFGDVIGGGTVPPPNPGGQEKTHQEVLSALQVVNSDSCLTGFSVGSDVSTVIAKAKSLSSNIQIVVKKANGTQITNGTVATGMKVSITTNGSTVEYTIVIRGDVSGDGKLSAIDYVKVRNYLDGANSLSGAYLKSADTSGDGKTSALDYVKLRNHLDNKSAIVQ